MTETISNTVQLALTGLCAACALYRAFTTERRAWTLFALFAGLNFLGNLYWLLWLVFYGDSPPYAFIPYLSWYASYLFLALLLLQVKSPEQPRLQARTLWLVPVFAAGMFVFYVQYGDWVGNIVCAALMGLLLWQAIGGLLFLRGKRGAAAKNRFLYWAVLLFCFVEYALWTVSCFWTGDSLKDPYFWFDLLLSLCFPILLPAVERAVDA